jgi:Cytochrome C'
MIAVYAQEAKDNAPAMATLRDQALRVMKAAQAGKADETKKLAADLTPDIKSDPASKPGALALEKQLDLETLMRIFSGEKVGGFGMEKSLEDLVDAKGLDATQLDKAHLLGQKISLIAKVAHAYAPASDQGKKTKKAWNMLAAEMQNNAGELASAAQAKKEGDIGKIANKLSETCNKCHEIFR